MFHTNDDFLRAIEADPCERTPRLVYADWLAEHDAHDRAELIRVEEEMRQVPVFADRFWELKPRRNELRTQVGAEWCGQMRYGTECEPVFRHGIPDGWRERWRLIREFTERWHRIPMPDIGGRQAEIAVTETRLGRVLPPSVREWIAVAHDSKSTGPPRPDGYEFRSCVFHDPDRMEDVPGQAALSLLLQTEGDYYWAIRHDNLNLSDPPVHGYQWADGNFEPDEERNPLAPTVTEFTLDRALTYTYGNSLGDWVTTQRADPAAVRRELAATFPPPTRFGNSDIYEAENLMVYAMPLSGSSDIWFRMMVFKSLAREQMPASLWEHSNNG